MVKEVEQNITKYLNIEEKDSEKKSYQTETFLQFFQEPT